MRLRLKHTTIITLFALLLLSACQPTNVSEMALVSNLGETNEESEPTTVPLQRNRSDVNEIAQEKAKEKKITFAGNIQPFLKQHCAECHGRRRQRGDISFHQLTTENAVKDQKLWEKVARVVRSGEMPPRGRKRPTVEEYDAVVNWIDHKVFQVDCGKDPNPGRPTIRRLNKAEYNNTIRDLVGVNFKPAKTFPSDDVGYGFDNIGDVLTLSPLLVEKYLEAAEKVVETAWNNPKTFKRIFIRELNDSNDTKTARIIIADFARRAYRRPVTDAEVDRLMRFVTLAQKNKDSVEVGIRLAAKAILVSPHFLFRVEKDRPAENGKTSRPVNDFELASRLSYFLWSSMPDEELFQVAAKKQLRDPKILSQQVNRMLTDPKSEALVKNFAGQWLQLRNLRQKAVNPDPDVFPNFDDKLREAMVRETELFFLAIMKEDRSVMELLDADFTFVNERLAKHYGIPGIRGEEFRKVQLRDVRRGGILTHASILTVTSNPTRTSPVTRGKWVLENILNAPPPPAPPDVPELPEDEKTVASGSLRKRLEIHRRNPTCASCHQRMDPIGFGLENFNAVGAWRDKDGKFTIDASGELPSGEKFKGPKELRGVLMKAKGKEFRRCVIEKMLTYALGRGLEYYDRCAIDEIHEEMVENNHRFSSLVKGIVLSPPFRMRKGVQGK
ncbi:MAG: DUF1592 domain-containing protein [Gemmataceae bacterium]